MADARGAGARLRKTFHYPAEDEDSDSQPEAIDEQEQESLIQRLAAENASRNATFRLLLLPLPLLTTLPYLLNQPLSFRSLLALTSLLSTAYLLYVQPPDETGIPFLDALARQGFSAVTNSGARSSPTAAQRQRRARVTATSQPSRLPFDEEGPLGKYLPYLNAGLGVVVALASFLGRNNGGSSKASGHGWIGLGTFPGLVYGAVIVAKMVMRGVDPEGQLGALKYQYKGA